MCFIPVSLQSGTLTESSRSYKKEEPGKSRHLHRVTKISERHNCVFCSVLWWYAGLTLVFFWFWSVIASFLLRKRIINVRQRPCSVRSERDAGTYVEFCRLPERLGSSSNNNNDNDNDNNRAHHIPRHNTTKYLALLALLKMAKWERKDNMLCQNWNTSGGIRASDGKMQTPVIQIHQIIITTDYFELFSMLSVTIVSSLMAVKTTFSSATTN